MAKAIKSTTTHPRSKREMKIDASVYETFKAAIIQSLKGSKARLTGKNKNNEGGQGKTFSQLTDEVTKTIRKKMPGFKKSIPWYTITIRLDLETRGLVETFTENGIKLNRITPSRLLSGPKGEK